MASRSSEAAATRSASTSREALGASARHLPCQNSGRCRAAPTGSLRARGACSSAGAQGSGLRPPPPTHGVSAVCPEDQRRSRCAHRGISPAGAREYTNNDSRYRYRRSSRTLNYSGVRWLPRCRPWTQTVLAGTELHDACSTRPEHDASEAGGRYRELRHVRAWHQRDGILDRGEGMV